MYVDRAVVLAAGVGARLKWLTRERPKALMPVGGTTAIEFVIRRLAAQGIHDIAINLHHHPEAIVSALGYGERLGVRLVYSREAKLLDSGGGVRQALSLLPGEGLVAVHNTDVISNVPLQRLAARVLPGGGCLALVPNPAHHPHGDFGLQSGRVVPNRKGNSYTFAGISVFDPVAIADWPETVFPLSDVLKRLMSEGRLAGYRHEGRWLDIGRPHDLFAAPRHLQAWPA
jgi:N-acetyl-alpha-D-muramate 1-phosphate uridylyltransferase